MERLKARATAPYVPAATSTVIDASSNSRFSDILYLPSTLLGSRFACKARLDVTGFSHLIGEGGREGTKTSDLDSSNLQVRHTSTDP